MAGRSKGSVMLRNRCQAEAPSSAAASWRFGGMFCRPASRITMKKPTICHTAATTTEGIAHS